MAAICKVCNQKLKLDDLAFSTPEGLVCEICYKSQMLGLGKQIPIKNLNYEQEDIVNHPTHYHQNGIDVIGFSELQFSKEELKGFYRINVLKYVTRYDRKGGADDLKKAEFYLNKLKEL